jgi:HEAT repeat protein
MCRRTWVNCVALLWVMSGMAAYAAAPPQHTYKVQYVETKKGKDGYYVLRLRVKRLTLDELLKELKSADKKTRRGALDAIRGARDWPSKDRKALTRAVGELVKDKDPAIRITACETLTYAGPGVDAVLQSLIDAVKDDEVLVRSRAIRAIERLGPKAKAAAPALVKALEDDNRFIPGMASRALGEIGVAAVPALIKALKSPKAKVREEAASALMQIGPAAKDALPALRGLEDDKADRVSYMARRAIRAIEVSRPKNR